METVKIVEAVGSDILKQAVIYLPDGLKAALMKTCAEEMQSGKLRTIGLFLLPLSLVFLFVGAFMVALGRDYLGIRIAVVLIGALMLLFSMVLRRIPSSENHVKVQN